MSSAAGSLAALALMVAFFVGVRGVIAAMRGDVRQAFALLQEAEQQSPGHIATSLLKVLAGFGLALLLAALTGCGEKKPEVDQKLVDWFIAHEADARAELKKCAELSKGKAPEWNNTDEGLRCRAATLAGNTFQPEPLAQPRQFRGGSK